jgi:hypothetical protein
LSTNTTNYNFIKPELTDSISQTISDLSTDMNLIDGELKNQDTRITNLVVGGGDSPIEVTDAHLNGVNGQLYGALKTRLDADYQRVRDLAFNVKDPQFGAIGNGSTDDYAAINSANAAASINGGNICFPPGTYLINSNITFANNVRLLPSPGAKLKIANAKTITGTNTKIDAGIYQIFDLSLGGAIGGTWDIKEVYPEWFGAVGDSVTDDTTAIQYTINNFTSISFLEKTYVTTGLTINKNFTIHGNKGTLKLTTDTNRITIDSTGEYLIVYDLNITSSGSKTDGKNTTGIKHAHTGGGSYFRFYNVYVEKMSGNGILIHDGIQGFADTCMCYSCTYGITCNTSSWTATTTSILKNIYVTGCTRGLYLDSFYHGILDNIIAEYNTYGIYAESGNISMTKIYCELNATAGLRTINTYFTLDGYYANSAGDVKSINWDSGVALPDRGYTEIDSGGSVVTRNIQFIGDMRDTVKTLTTHQNSGALIDGLQFNNRALLQSQYGAVPYAFGHLVIDTDGVAHTYGGGTCNYVVSRPSTGIYEVLFKDIYGNAINYHYPFVLITPYAYVVKATWLYLESTSGDWASYRLVKGIQIHLQDTNGNYANGYCSVLIITSEGII